jgi:hypothetical protein
MIMQNVIFGQEMSISFQVSATFGVLMASETCLLVRSKIRSLNMEEELLLFEQE